jgi:hypothetical protein
MSFIYFQLWSGNLQLGRRQIDLFAKTASINVSTDFTTIPTEPIRLPSRFRFHRLGKTGMYVRRFRLILAERPVEGWSRAELAAL